MDRQVTKVIFEKEATVCITLALVHNEFGWCSIDADVDRKQPGSGVSGSTMVVEPMARVFLLSCHVL